MPTLTVKICCNNPDLRLQEAGVPAPRLSGKRTGPRLSGCTHWNISVQVSTQSPCSLTRITATLLTGVSSVSQPRRRRSPQTPCCATDARLTVQLLHRPPQSTGFSKKHQFKPTGGRAGAANCGRRPNRFSPLGLGRPSRLKSIGRPVTVVGSYKEFTLLHWLCGQSCVSLAPGRCTAPQLTIRHRRDCVAVF